MTQNTSPGAAERAIESRGRYSVFRCDLANNQEDVIGLWERNAMNIPEAKYSWLYNNNPLGRAACWLARHNASNSIVGSAALFPRVVQIRGSACKAGIAGDFGVLKEHRAFGPALTIQKAAVSSALAEFDLLYGIPNRLSELVLCRVGYQIAGPVTWLTKPLRSHALLKDLANVPVLTQLASKPIDAALRLKSRETYYRRPEKFAFEELSAFDERADRLWGTAAKQYPICAERTKEVLNWRYTKCPFRNFEVMGLFARTTEDLLGYICSYWDGDRVHIADLFAIDSGDVFEALVSEFLLRQRKLGATAISLVYFGDPSFVQKCRPYGFLERQNQSKMVVYAPSGSPLWPTIVNRANWSLFGGDTDL